jgi:hypothetical protein
MVMVMVEEEEDIHALVLLDEDPVLETIEDADLKMILYLVK